MIDLCRGDETDDDEADNLLGTDEPANQLFTQTPIAPQIIKPRRASSSLRVRLGAKPAAGLEWLLAHVKSAPADDKVLFYLPEGEGSKGLRYTGDGLMFRHAHHIRTLDTASSHDHPRAAEIVAARTALNDAFARMQQQEQVAQGARKRGRQAGGDSADAAPPSSARAKKRKVIAPAPGVNFDDPLAAFYRPEHEHLAQLNMQSGTPQRAADDDHTPRTPAADERARLALAPDGAPSAELADRRELATSAPADERAASGERARRAHDLGEPALEQTSCKISVTFRKPNGGPEIMPQKRRDHSSKITARAGKFFTELAADGRALLYSFSVEQAESDKGGRNFHVQGFAVILCKGDAALACEMLKALMFALDYADDAVKTIVYVEPVTDAQNADEDFIGAMIAYTLKDAGKDTYENVRGGSKWSDATCAAWVEAYNDRTANINTLGFKKRNFCLSDVKSRLKIDNMNLIPAVTNFTNRQQLSPYQASFLRRLSWMLMTGNYEPSAAMVIARFANGCNDLRIEALVHVCENPAAARDLRLIQSILCGAQPAGSTGVTDTRALRRVPRFVDEEVEKYDWNDIQALRDTGVAPVRFRLPATIRRRWPEKCSAGSAIIVDLDATDAKVQRSLLKIMRQVEANDMGLHPLFYEHGRHCSCDDGLLSTGYIEAVLNRAHVCADESCQFNDLSVLDVFPYCTPLFAHYVEDARARHSADAPLLALAKALDLDAFAASKKCELLGIVDVEHALKLLKDRRPGSMRTSAAIVRCENAQNKPHHFALVWTRARAPPDCDGDVTRY